MAVAGQAIAVDEATEIDAGIQVGDRVRVDGVVEGGVATPVSAVLVKPDGCRTVVNYRKNTPPLDPGRIDLEPYRRVIWFSGAESL